jgi:hypothetical protein
MVRAGLVALGLASASGCSLALDFSPGAIPVDAPPYSQNECEYAEPNNALEEAAVLTTEDTGPAAICGGAGDPEDHDFYRFTVPPNTASVSVRVRFASGPTGDLDLRLTDAAGVMVGQSRGFGDEELVVCPGASPRCLQLPAGDYVIEVFPAKVGSVNRYEIALSITPM